MLPCKYTSECTYSINLEFRETRAEQDQIRTGKAQRKIGDTNNITSLNFFAPTISICNVIARYEFSISQSEKDNGFLGLYKIFWVICSAWLRTILCLIASKARIACAKFSSKAVVDIAIWPGSSKCDRLMRRTEKLN